MMCKYQFIVGVTCCKAQNGCPPVSCPKNITDCLAYNKMNNIMVTIESMIGNHVNIKDIFTSAKKVLNKELIK